MRASGQPKGMRKIVRKRIRRSAGAVNIAADIDAVIVVNTGDEAGVSRTVARSSHTVVQGARPAPDANDPTKETHDRRQEPQAPDA